MNLDFSYTMVWIVIAIIFGIIEAVTLGLATIWFAIAALVAVIVAAIGLSIGIQVAVFLVVSLVLLVSTRPIAIKHFKVGTTKTNADALIGKTGIVREKIAELGTGIVVVDKQIWTATSEDDKEIQKGVRVEILGISGVKLIVKAEERGE